MNNSTESQALVRAHLASIYEEVMWLAQRPHHSPSGARAWYTHVAHLGVRKHIRRFTGKVSREAAFDEKAELRLEHFKRMQTTLTQLVARHLKSRDHNATEFIDTVLDCEQVHIVTKKENYLAMSAKGDYTLAGIELLDWLAVPLSRRQTLWKKVLRGRVSNAADFSDTADEAQPAAPSDATALRRSRR